MGENPNTFGKVAFMMDTTPCDGCGKVHPVARIFPITSCGFASRRAWSVEDGIRILDEGIADGFITLNQRKRLFRQLIGLGNNGLPLSEAEAEEKRAEMLLQTLDEKLRQMMEERESPDDPIGDAVKGAIVEAVQQAFPGAKVRTTTLKL